MHYAYGRSPKGGRLIDSLNQAQGELVDLMHYAYGRGENLIDFSNAEQNKKLWLESLDSYVLPNASIESAASVYGL